MVKLIHAMSSQKIHNDLLQQIEFRHKKNEQNFIALQALYIIK